MTGPITLSEAERHDLWADLCDIRAKVNLLLPLIERDQPQPAQEFCEWEEEWHGDQYLAGWVPACAPGVLAKTYATYCTYCGKPVREKEE